MTSADSPQEATGSNATKAVRPVVRLADDRLPRGPWLYTRRIEPPIEGPSAPQNGDLVEVHDHSGRFFGHGFWNGASDVRVRMLNRGRKRDLDRPRQFLLERLKAADDLRRKTLRLPEVTNAYRIVHGEGDDLSGLVVDRLGDVLVVEYHALGFFRLRAEVEWALQSLYRDARVVHRVPDSALRADGFDPREVKRLPRASAADEVIIEEHGLKYPVLPAGGHKTGFFCDQRDNRRRVGALAAERRVLDLCTNSGGFALSAARAGARHVLAVDLDERVLPRAERAAALNELTVEWRHADAYPCLRELAQNRKRFELVVSDPPKLAAGRNQLESALVKYTDLNALAMGVVAPRGLLATFSCSGALDLATFMGTLFAAARRAGREVQLLETMGAGPDHPQRPEFPRSRYLKGALLALD